VDQREQIWPWVTFDVELDVTTQRAQQCSHFSSIGRSDVAGIRPRVHRNTRNPRIDADANSVQDGRDCASSRITKRRDFVDVDG
jgi:hypothetical protein